MSPGKETSAKPQGPLIIAISIEKQKLRVYDANGFFAETPISTGMRGHTTPMGVFSVIQKQKLHHSNIYSGAPMPFMQRITWSGIAIHAGVLPGYPASHGCIRMPMAFAVKMYGWTRMGVRVVVTPGEITPASFSHPLLAGQKVAPQPVAADVPKSTEKSTEKAGVEPGSTIARNDRVKPVMVEPSAATLLRERTRTADASSNLSATNAPVTMSDATPDAGAIKADQTSNTDTKSEAATPQAEAGMAKPDEPKSDPPKSVENSDDKVKAAADAAAPDTKEQTRSPDTAAASKPNPAAAPAPKRTGPIAVFISRKDAKLYVRQNFAPLFDVPVTIAPNDRPLGTHVFTAQTDKDDANVLRWSVISLPASTRNAERRDEDERASRRRKMAGAVEMKKPMPVPDSPAEALDRLGIPADAMARITEALSTGGSIIVSDQGITAGETGEGTDFIVSLR